MDVYDDEDFKEFDLDLEESELTENFEYKPSYVLIIIDTDELMFSGTATNSSAFKDSLNVCYNVANSLILTDKRALKGPLGVILATNELASSNLIEFEKPIPETITMLNDLKNQTNNDLKSKYQRKGDFDLGDFFLFCKNKLVEVNANVYKRTVMYITNDDNPTGDDVRKRFKLIHESQKFSSVKMNLIVVTFKANFDSKIVYSEILETSKDSSVEIVNTTNLTEKISSLMKKKYFKYSSKFYPFNGDTKRYLEVVTNKFISATKIFKNMYVTRDTEKEVKRYTKPSISTTSKCKYSKSETPLIINNIEKDGFTETNLPVGFTLLCVNEQISKPGWIIEVSSLMEKHNREKQPIFDIFWQFCIEKSRCLVCYRKLKKCGDVRIVELIPKYINRTRVFLVKVLPFGPEIYYPFVNKEKAVIQAVDRKPLNSFIDALTFDYQPNNFIDPVESKKKAYIESRLLNKPMKQIEDGIPSDKAVDYLIKTQVQVLRDLDLIDELPGSKRSAKSATTKTGRQKKMKTE